MKKIFVFIMVLALMAAMIVPAAASELPAEADEITEATDSVTEEESEEESLFTRLSEIWNTYSAEIISGGGILTVISGLIVFWKKIKPILLNAISGLATIITGVDEKTKKPTQQSKVLNGIVDGIESLDKRIDEFRCAIDEVKTEREATKEHFDAVERELCALAKAIELAYSNSKLPQGVKDMVAVECAACLRIAEEDMAGSAAVSAEEATAYEQQS